MGKLYSKPGFYIPFSLLFIIIVIIVAQFMPNDKTPARFHNVVGDVQVDDGNGFTQAVIDQELDEGATIRTGADGSAIIVLYESVIVRLKESSQVTVSDLAKERQALTQQSGSVWSKIAKLGGKEEYSIQTPTTTATVRGTSFLTKDDAGQYALIVNEGTVEAGGFTIVGGEKLVKNGDVFEKVPLTEEDKVLMREQLAIELQTLRELRLREIYKNDMAVSFVRATYKATNEQIAQFLIDIDEGRQSEDVIRENAPVITPSVEVVFAYNAEIKKVLETIALYA